MLLFSYEISDSRPVLTSNLWLGADAASQHASIEN
jgi:hypothetical protein